MAGRQDLLNRREYLCFRRIRTRRVCKLEAINVYGFPSTRAALYIHLALSAPYPKPPFHISTTTTTVVLWIRVVGSRAITNRVICGRNSLRRRRRDAPSLPAGGRHEVTFAFGFTVPAFFFFFFFWLTEYYFGFPKKITELPYFSKTIIQHIYGLGNFECFPTIWIYLANSVNFGNLGK